MSQQPKPKPARCPDPCCKSRQFNLAPDFRRAPDGTAWVCWHCGEVVPDRAEASDPRPAARGPVRQAELWAGA